MPKNLKDQLFTEARAALQQGDIKWMQEQIDGGQLDLPTITETLRIYQTELEIQNEELRTAQQANERALIRSARLFAELPEAGFIINPLGLILDANQEATRLFGMSYRQLHHHFIQRLVDPRMETGVREAIARAYTVQTRQVIIASLITKGDLNMVGELHLSRLSSAEQAVDTELVCIVVDLTEHESARNTLALLHRRASYLLELPKLIEGMDEQAFLQRGLDLAETLTGSSIGFLHFVNEDQATIELGTWSSATLTDCCQAVFDRHYPLTQAGIWADAFRQRAPVVINDYATTANRRGLPTGHATLYRLITTPVIDGSLIRLIAGVGNKPTPYTAQDIESLHLIVDTLWRIIRQRRADTALHLQNQELAVARIQAESSVRLKSEFLANMSHEIRTPMNAIINLTDLVLQTKLNEQQQDYLIKVQRASRNLLGIINDILDFSKIEAGKLIVENNEFDLRQVLIDAADLLGGLAKGKPLALRFDVNPNLPRHLQGDALRLGQVLNNLLSNAIKFTDSGEVVLSIRHCDGDGSSVDLVFAVRDTGIGMSQDQISQLFQAFHQVDRGITRKYGGTGLGLIISRRLVALMGGDLQVTSTLGQGTTFSFILSFPQINTIPLIAQEEIGSLNQLSTLIIDPNPIGRDFLKELLNNLKFKLIYTADSIADAQQQLNKININQQISLILLSAELFDNINNRPISCSELFQLNDQPPPHTIIVATTFDPPILLPGLAQMCNAVLVNPITPYRLLAAITKALDQSEAPQQMSIPTEQASQINYLAGTRILLVEDHEINQDVALALLRPYGVIVEVAVNGTVALEQLKEKNYDLVLMDLQMPVMDGYETTRRIRRDLGLTQIPIIAMTAHALEEDHQRCLRVGMNDYLAKPIDVQQLYQTLLHWLNYSATPDDSAIITTSSSNIVASLNLPHIDCEAGLRRMNNDITAYYQTLHSFLKRHQEIDIYLAKLLQEKSWEDAQRLIHGIKGTAGNLGMKALWQASIALEIPLLQSQAPTEDNITAFYCALQEILQVLQNLDKEPITSGESECPPLAKLLDALHSLQNLLDEDMEQARLQLAKIQEWLIHTDFNSEAHWIATAIREFDLDLAQREIARLIERLMKA